MMTVFFFVNNMISRNFNTDNHFNLLQCLRSVYCLFLCKCLFHEYFMIFSKVAIILSDFYSRFSKNYGWHLRKLFCLRILFSHKIKHFNKKTDLNQRKKTLIDRSIRSSNTKLGICSPTLSTTENTTQILI